MTDTTVRAWKRGVAAFWIVVVVAALFGYWLIISTLF
jgi:hypothetical protein